MTTKMTRMLGVGLFLLTGLAQADGVLDRSAEIEKYTRVFALGTRILATQAAKEIYNADLADPQLAAALYATLANATPGLSDKSVADMQYQRAMISALASFGIADYAPAIKVMCGNIKSFKKLTYCDEELAKIAWYKSKNQIAAGVQYQCDGNNPRCTRLLNLVMADDFSYKAYATQRMNNEKQFDLRLLDAIAPQVLQFMDSTTHSVTRAQIDAIAFYVRSLGNSNNPKYRDVIERVLNSKAGPIVMMRAREAQKRLR